MDFLEQIKLSLKSNPNINDDIRNKFFELISIFHKKLPEVPLNRLNEKLKTVSFTKLGKFERKGEKWWDKRGDLVKNLFLNYNLVEHIFTTL